MTQLEEKLPRLFIKNGKDGIPSALKENLRICKPFPAYYYFHFAGCKGLDEIKEYCIKKAEKSKADVVLLHTVKNYGKKNEKFAGVIEFYRLKN